MIFPKCFWAADDHLIENMRKNEKVVVGGVEFEVFRTPSNEPDKAAFPNEDYKVSVGADGLLYARRKLWGSTPQNPKYETVLASSYLLPYAANFIVDTSGQMYVFHNTDRVDTQRDRAFMFSEPEILAAGSIVIHQGKILAMAPVKAHGQGDERALIRFATLLRAQGYEEHPLVLSDTDDSFKMVMEAYRTRSLEKDFYTNFLREFRKHLESVDHHLGPRQGDCKGGLQGVPSKSKLFRI